MHDSSIFRLTLDYEKSERSYFVDKISQKSYLDFFGLYSSLPLGYNHPIFKTQDFQEEYNRIASVKVPNCEVRTEEAQSFFDTFSKHSSMKSFSKFHFCCTGGLGIEAAVKTAVDYKQVDDPIVLSLQESFHGINSYGGFLTDRFDPVSQRLNGFVEMNWPKLINPKYIYHQGDIDFDATVKRLDQFKNEFESCLKMYGDRIAGIVVEPIQATYGDNYFSSDFFQYIREQCTQHNIALIFDEIQVGFLSSGKMWYFEHLGIVPDIVVFGKKAQTSGIMVREQFDAIFRKPIRLEVTWDGDVTDFVRCKYIMKAYEQFNIVDNIAQRHEQLSNGLSRIKGILNLRSVGLLFAFDFDSGEKRDVFFNKVVSKQFMCNKTRSHSIRLRPNLNVSEKEVNEALTIIESSV